MAEQMSEAAALKVKELCAKVSVAQGLDKEIGRELRGHMEDELLAYLSGRQRLSEDDALILVERHFGDPAVVRGLLRTVHHVDSNISVLRRLLGVLCVTCAAAVVCRLAGVAVGWIGGGQAMSIFSYFVVAALGSISIWGAGIWWTRRARRGHTPWFDRLPIAVLVCFVAASIVLAQLAHWMAFQLFPPTNPGVDSAETSTLMLVVFAWGAINYGASVAAWAWWCDWPGIGTRRAGFAAAAWVAWHLLGTVLALAQWLLFGSQQDQAQTLRVIGQMAASWGIRSLIAVIVGFGLYRLVVRFALRPRLGSVA